MIGIMTRLCSLTMILKPSVVETTFMMPRYTPLSGVASASFVYSVMPLNQLVPTGLAANGLNSAFLSGGLHGLDAVSFASKRL